jgi:hypothetical protein
MEQYLNLIPVPIALGMVLYTNYAIDKHKKECDYPKCIGYLGEKIDSLHEDVREIRANQNKGG